MRKKGLITLAVVLICFSATAQEIQIDTTLQKTYSKLNDYSLLGISYGVALSQPSFSPERMQEFLFVPVNIGITYTRYGKMFGYMPYFGFKAGLYYTREGYSFKENTSGVRDYINYAGKAVMETVELPIFAHFHYDLLRLKLMVDLGPYIGYRLSIHREYEDYISEDKRTYENSFHPLENRFDYGIKGGGGLALVFDPIEIHLMVHYKFSLSNLHVPNVNDRTMERDENSKYYYKWAYPTNILFSLGVNYQLTKRYGRTRAVLKKEAKEEALRMLKEAEEATKEVKTDETDNSEDRQDPDRS